MTERKPLGNIIFALFALCVATVGVAYLSGLIYLLMNKQSLKGLNLSTWYAYWHYYGSNPAVAKKLKVAAAMAVGICYVAPILVVLANLKRGRELHGSARFATAAEIAKSPLNADAGIVVGKTNGRYLIFSGQEFVILAAPTRSGKGVGFVIPNMLSYESSVVQLDIKQENFRITSGYRAANGQEVYLFNPFAEDFRTHRYNMLGYISDDPRYRVSDVQSIGQSLYPDPTGNQDPFFQQAARNLFLGLSLYLCETPALPRTIGELLRQSSGKGKPVKEYLQGIINARNFTEVEEWEDVLDGDGVPKVDKDTGEIKRRKVKVLTPRIAAEGEDPVLSDHCVDALNRFLSTSDNTLSSILASLNAPLTIWANPIVDAATSANDFDLRDVRKRRMTIYIGITPDHLAEASLLINVFFSQLLNLNTKELPEDNPALKFPCLLLLDEFTAIGKVPPLAKGVSYLAGYNMRLATIIQSMSQLGSVYGMDDARTMVTNHALQILYAPREQKDANEYSEMLGTYTEKNTSKSRALGKGGGSESTSDQRRALLLPQELKEIGKWKEIINLENVKPILCDKIRWFDDPVFMERANWPVPKVPLLDLDLHQAIVEARTRELTPEDVEGGVDLSRLALDLNLMPASGADDTATAEEVNAAVDALFAAMGVAPAAGDSDQVVGFDGDQDGGEAGDEAGEALLELPVDERGLNLVAEADEESERSGFRPSLVDSVVAGLELPSDDEVDLSVLDGDDTWAAADEAPTDGVYGSEAIDLSQLD